MGEIKRRPLWISLGVFASLAMARVATGPTAAQPESPADGGRSNASALARGDNERTARPTVERNAANRYAVATVRTSPSQPNIAPRLAAHLRSSAEQQVEFLVRGVPAERLRAATATITGQVGPIISGRANAQAIMQVGAAGGWWDAPQPLRPALDVARSSVGADQADEGRDFSMPARGAGVLLATYDSGLDLTHPDFRTLNGETRVRTLWDQDGVGTPPAAGFGNECGPSAIDDATCAPEDTDGHGTAVLAAAASSGPQYRGIAPEADLLVVRSSTLGALIPAMTYAAEFASAAEQPLVFTVSSVGHQGPHDGTSLEAQAIDAYPHLVVAAAGNEGELAIHATSDLSSSEVATVPLRFGPALERQDRRAIVNVWGAIGRDDLEVSVGLVNISSILEVETATIGAGAPGRTDALILGQTTIGEVELDASNGRIPANDRVQITVGITLNDWEDAPDGPGYIILRIRGSGVMHAWVDSPPTEPFPVQFDIEDLFDGQVLGDTASTVSDIATASSAVAVGAYVTRNSAPVETGETLDFDVETGDVAAFTSRGPSLRPTETGPKPDLAAPGQFLVTARSRQSPRDTSTLSDLYRVSAGTSVAAAQVAGTAAILLSAQPDLLAGQLKRTLLETADRAALRR